MQISDAESQHDYGYSRVSTDAQGLSNQVAQLKAAGCETVFREKITGTHAERPQLEFEASRARALLGRLNTSLLAKAFRGELVSQDAADEPASILLERDRTAPFEASEPLGLLRAETSGRAR